ncbi:short-chain dehydrogenase [Mycolicibacterium setense]|uniref:SDR family NAD(P)-dependent oxidoreductase n=1 Tax=Mycolicibacterium setense TaxID=431269 RepID=UPI0007EAF792|nr:SDR family NAD(P)-dependent oxidoreductase [Mycolicibacterium setense]OBB17650.1 short-chain dehydrogenase [Mycolicibacterium setense]
MWGTSDIPDQSGRTAVVTGGNSGLGFRTAAALAEKGAKVILAVRNTRKGEEALSHIEKTVAGASVSIQPLDLASLASVRSAATQLCSEYDSIDLLINNAGIMVPPRTMTEDGFELQFGTNHLGHFALTGLLLDRLLAAPGSRVVTVSSLGHKYPAPIRFDDLQWERGYRRMGAYGQSKLANLLFTYELQRRLSGTETSAVAAHPGGSRTELGRNHPLYIRLITAPFDLFSQSAADGALPTLRGATDPGVLGGQYYGPSSLGGLRGNPRVVLSSAQSYDFDMQKRLWAVSEELTGVTFPSSSGA